MLAEREMNEELKKTCHWKEDSDGFCYETGCGNAHVFIDGGPKENNYKYCPYCGGRLVLDE